MPTDRKFFYDRCVKYNVKTVNMTRKSMITVRNCTLGIYTPPDKDVCLFNDKTQTCMSLWYSIGTFEYYFLQCKVSKGAKIRNRYNQVPQAFLTRRKTKKCFLHKRQIARSLVGWRLMPVFVTPRYSFL